LEKKVSCQSKNKSVSRLAAARCGVSQIATRTAGLYGTAAGRLLAVAGAVEGPGSVDNLLPLAAAGALATEFRRRRPDDNRRPSNWRLRVLNTVGGLKLGRSVSGSAGTALARLSKPGSAQMEQRRYFGGRVTLRRWPSRLTAALNAADIPPIGVTVKRSGGQMVEYQGRSWHAGTSIVDTPAGERAITHLQSLQWPARHYYFNRALGGQTIAGIISGHPEFEPKHLPGFAGQVGEVEALMPGVGATKRHLIRAALLWGGAGVRG